VHQIIWQRSQYMFVDAYVPPPAWLALLAAAPPGEGIAESSSSSSSSSSSDPLGGSPSRPATYAAAALAALGDSSVALDSALEDAPFKVATNAKDVPIDDEPFFASARGGKSNSSHGRVVQLAVEFSVAGLQGLRPECEPELSYVAAGYDAENRSTGKASAEAAAAPPLTPRQLRDRAFRIGPVAQARSAADYWRAQEGGGVAGALGLYACFDKFREREQLGENDEWYCPRCKNLVRAFKEMDLWSSPEVLVIHLKRFYYERNQYVRSWVDREKIDDLVVFPLDGLRLNDYVRGWREGHAEPEPVYDLFAVSNHIGGLGGGHYTAHVKNRETGKWFLMDDSRVTPADEADVVSEQAYVLFYKRRQVSAH
jgi:hypothetical protein